MIIINLIINTIMGEYMHMHGQSIYRPYKHYV